MLPNVEREKRVVLVFVELRMSPQSSVHLPILLTVCCILQLAVEEYSEAVHTARSSACRLFETCLGIMLVMSFMYTKKSVGKRTPPCGTPSRSLTFLLWKPSTFTLAVLPKRQCLTHLCILLCTPARSSFKRRPSFQTLTKAFVKSKKTAKVFFFS